MRFIVKQKLLSYFCFLIVLITPFVMNAGWSPAETLPYKNTNAENPSIAVDANGNYLAVWMMLDGNVMAAYLPNGAQQWESAQVISSTSGEKLGAKVAMNELGQAIAIWQLEDGTIEANKFSNGSWSEVETVAVSEDGVGAYSRQVEVSIDNQGNAIAVWTIGSAVTQIQSAVLKGFSKWTEPHYLTNLGNFSQPYVNINAGIGVVTWSKGGANRGIQAVQVNLKKQKDSLFGKTMNLLSVGKGKDVSIPALGHYLSRVAVSSSGNAVVIWQNGSTEIMQSLTISSAGQLSKIVDISDGENYAYESSIGIDFAGNVVALWNEFDDSGNTYVKSSTLPVGGEWSKPLQLDKSSSYIDSPIVVLNNDGQAAAFWHVHDKDEIRYAKPTSEGQWSKPKMIVALGTTSFLYGVAMAPANIGTMAAIWEYNSVDPEVQVSVGNELIPM